MHPNPFPQDYTAAIQRDSRNHRAIYNRGNCYRKVGELKASAEDLRSAVEIQPGKAAADTPTQGPK